MVKEDLTILEQMIDRTSLEHVLITLSEICAAKAEHLQVNWQDVPAAKSWIKDSNRFEECARQTEN